MQKEIGLQQEWSEDKTGELLFKAFLGLALF
jgi:hypothetical protein